MALPITLVGWLLQLGYAHLLRDVHDEINHSRLPSFIGMAVPLPLLFVSLVARSGGSFEDWTLVALIFVGSSYVTFLAIAMFILVRAGGGKHYHYASVAPWIVLGPSALLHAFAGSATVELDGLAALIWTVPGYVGLVAGPVIILTFGLAAYERYRFERRQREPEPVFPEARVVRRRD